MAQTVIGKLILETGSTKLTAGSVVDTFASAEEAFAAACSGFVASVILGSRFGGAGSLSRRTINNPPTTTPPVVRFEPAAKQAIIALVLPGQAGTRVFVASDIDAAERWVDVAQMKEFYALPQATRTVQREAWIKALAAIKKSDWPAGVDLAKPNLQQLGSPVLRLLVAALGEHAVRVTGVNQPDKKFKGAQAHGLTLPLFSYPLVEPECYLRVIAGREGVLESINAYDEGAGVSLGPIQFNAQRATILKFLRTFDLTDPTLFEATFGREEWATSETDSSGTTIPVLDVTTGSGEVVTLLGNETSSEVRRTVAYLQSRKPDKGSFGDINSAWRKTVATMCRDAVVWPHVQALIQQTSGQWLLSGLRKIDASGLPKIDPIRPDRATFILRALLLSANVRYSASLEPFLEALKPFATPAAKLAQIFNVLLDKGTPWQGLSFAQRRRLAERLDAQDEDAALVWETIIKLADGASLPAVLTPATILPAKPVLIADEDFDLHDFELAPGQHETALEAFAVSSSVGVVLDPSVAIPPFVESKRKTILQPLLGATASATAIAWNGTRHPNVSGVSAATIAQALAAYVDFKSVEKALGLKWNGAIDAVFVEAVHQLQRKIFVDGSDHDGRAGEASLDALGFFFGRPGLNSVDVANPTAQAHLNSAAVKARIAAAKDNPGSPFTITAENWFRQMMQASFLGQKFSNGIHAAFVRRLRRAELHLLGQAPYAGMTPVELGAALGIRESHKGSRPTATTGSMHTFGLASDINYIGNPWVKGTNFGSVVRRAGLFIGGDTLPPGTGAEMFFTLTLKATPEIYDTLDAWNRSFKAYLALKGESAKVKAIIEDHVAKGTSGIVRNNESIEAATARWLSAIQSDLSELDDGDGFSNRDPRNGFLDLHRDLVLALRDHGCLSWGATDFGPGNSGSGDVMHFDCRNTGVGRAVNKGFMPVERACP